MDANAITIGNFSIKWYSLFILIGVILGIFLVEKEARRFNINKDFIFNLLFWTIIIGILGARLYYVVFNYSLYKHDFLSIFKIWEGGLAIHGGIIFGLIVIVLYCKKYKVNTIKILDILSPALILAQAIGRWGNFFNQEAHGSIVAIETLQKLHIPNFIIEGMNINGLYYHPTFLYESLWCFIGFIIIIIVRRFKYQKKGNVLAFYLTWYGLGRFFIESLRTDSLMLGGIKVAQIVSIIMFIIGIGIFIINGKKGRFEDLYNSDENEIRF